MNLVQVSKVSYWLLFIHNIAIWGGAGYSGLLNAYPAITGGLNFQGDFSSQFVGGGGGMIAVPILTSILKKPQKVAHATAILVIFPITIISGIIYSVFGSFDYRIVLPSTLGVILGGVLGAICLKKLSNEVLRIIFSVVMLIFGVRLIFS